MASVCHIRDKETGGNLVSHVLAGERYHKRKEGVTHKTWYLFNDFAITPIEKVTHLHKCKIFMYIHCTVLYTQTVLIVIFVIFQVNLGYHNNNKLNKLELS